MQKLKRLPFIRKQLKSSNTVRQAKETNGTLLENITLSPNPSFGSYKLGWHSFNYSTRGWCHTVLEHHSRGVPDRCDDHTLRNNSSNSWITSCFPDENLPCASG